MSTNPHCETCFDQQCVASDGYNEIATDVAALRAELAAVVEERDELRERKLVQYRCEGCGNTAEAGTIDDAKLITALMTERDELRADLMDSVPCHVWRRDKRLLREELAGAMKVVDAARANTGDLEMDRPTHIGSFRAIRKAVDDFDKKRQTISRQGDE